MYVAVFCYESMLCCGYIMLKVHRYVVSAQVQLNIKINAVHVI